jgi:hypothetical protein
MAKVNEEGKWPKAKGQSQRLAARAPRCDLALLVCTADLRFTQFNLKLLFTFAICLLRFAF